MKKEITLIEKVDIALQVVERVNGNKFPGSDRMLERANKILSYAKAFNCFALRNNENLEKYPKVLEFVNKETEGKV